MATAVALLVHNQGFGFTVAEVKNMTLECMHEWIKQGDKIIQMMLPEEKEEPPPLSLEEQIKQATAKAGIKAPKVFYASTN